MQPQDPDQIAKGYGGIEEGLRLFAVPDPPNKRESSFISLCSKCPAIIAAREGKCKLYIIIKIEWERGCVSGPWQRFRHSGRTCHAADLTADRVRQIAYLICVRAWRVAEMHRAGA